MTEKIKNIYQRILSVMAEVDYIQKGEKRVANQYRFCSHDQVTATIHPQLVKHGIMIIPTIKERKQDGNRTEILLEVKFINIDNPTDYFVVDALGYGIDTSDKGPGKAVSYAYKYALLKTFALETGDDPDQDQNTKYEPEDPYKPKEIKTYVDSFGDDVEWFKAYVDFNAKKKKMDIPTFIKKCTENDKEIRESFFAWKESNLKVV